jgi:hypothetical protein
MSPIMVPTTSTATITASQYRIRRLLMKERVLLSRQKSHSFVALEWHEREEAEAANPHE